MIYIGVGVVLSGIYCYTTKPLCALSSFFFFFKKNISSDYVLFATLLILAMWDANQFINAKKKKKLSKSRNTPKCKVYNS